MRPGDPVLLSGTYQMGGLGLEDDEALIETHGQYIKVRHDELVEAQPKPFPENLACVHKSDLRALLSGEATPDTWRSLQLALGEPVQTTDRHPGWARISVVALRYVLRRITADDSMRPELEAALKSAPLPASPPPWTAKRFFCATEWHDSMVTAIVLAPDKERAAAIAAQELNLTDPHEPIGFVVTEMAGDVAHDVKVERMVSYEGVTLGEHDPD